MAIDGRVQGLNRDAFTALQGIRNPRQMTTTEARRLESAIMRDNRIDAAEQDLIQELTSGRSQTVQITAAASAGFNPSALAFGQAQGEARTVIDGLKQVGGGNQNIDASDGGPSTATLVGIAADITGIVDPTPISDGVSGVISVSQGDWVGAGLSVASMVPWVGDGLAKPAKFLARIADEFPGLTRVARSAEDVPRLIRTISKLGTVNPQVLGRALTALSNMHEAAARVYARNPDWLARAQRQNLPTDGPVPFVPPDRWNPANPRRGPNHGFMDAYGNEWTRGPSRTQGEAFEWDVIPANRNSGLAAFSGDGSHVNVSLRGDVTHRSGGR